MNYVVITFLGPIVTFIAALQLVYKELKIFGILCLFLLHFRVFQDSQLQMIQEIMTQVYNMGAVVEECEVIMEFKRSGREGSVLPTDICNITQVQDVSLQ